MLRQKSSYENDIETHSLQSNKKQVETKLPAENPELSMQKKYHLDNFTPTLKHDYEVKIHWW